MVVEMVESAFALFGEAQSRKVRVIRTWTSRVSYRPLSRLRTARRSSCRSIHLFFETHRRHGCHAVRQEGFRGDSDGGFTPVAVAVIDD